MNKNFFAKWKVGKISEQIMVSDKLASVIRN